MTGYLMIFDIILGSIMGFGLLLEEHTGIFMDGTMNLGFA